MLFACKHAAISEYHCLQDVYAVANESKLYLEQRRDAVIQKMLQNEWKTDHNVTNVFVIFSVGTAIACSYNCLGSYQESTVAKWEGVNKKSEAFF